MMNYTILDILMAISFCAMLIGLLMGAGLSITAYIQGFKKPRKVVVAGHWIFFMGLIVAITTALIMRVN